MNIAVVGPGGLGTLFGGALARSGEDVWFLHHDPEAAREMAAAGMDLRGDSLPGSGRIRVRALVSAGFEDAVAVRDPMPHVWDKQLVSIAFKPLAALTRLPNEAISRTDVARSVARQPMKGVTKSRSETRAHTA